MRAALLAGVLALAAVAAGAARWPVAPVWVAGTLNAAFGPAPVMTWSAPGAASFSLFPWPSLRLVDARLDNAAGEALVAAPEARIDLSLAALLFGRPAPAGVALTAPTILLDLDRAPFSRKLDPAGAALSIARFAPLHGISVTDGVVRVTSGKRRLDTVINSVEGRIDGLSPGARLSLDLSAVWRDVALRASGSLDDPGRATLGRPSGVALSIASGLGELTFSGAMTAGPTLGAAGDLAVSSHALAHAALAFGAPPPPASLDGPVAISGKVKLGPDGIALDGATLSAGGQTLQGALRLARANGRVTISGSLDADSLALGPLLGPADPLLTPDGRWSLKPLSISLPRDLDLDLRLSAGALDVYGVSLANAAASALLKDGELAANLLDATALGGHVQGDLRIRCGDGLRLSTRGGLASADLPPVGAGFGWPDVSGKASGEFTAETSGRSPAELIAGLRGKASLAIEGGALADVNLEGALRRSQRRPLELAKDLRSGATAFDTADLELLIEGGVARVVEGRLVAQGLTADLQGAVDLEDRSLRLRVDARQSDTSGATGPDSARLSLDIDGPWSAPTVQARDPVDDDGPGQPAPAP